VYTQLSISLDGVDKGGLTTAIMGGKTDDLI